MASMAENILPLVNRALNTDPCVNLDNYQGRVPRRFLEDTLKTLDGLNEQGCPKEDRGCAQQIYELFEQDVKNVFNLFSSTRPQTTEMGCLSTLFANILDGLWSTAKLIFYEAPRGLWNLGRNAWDYFFAEESERSTALLYSSVMSETMAQALTDRDFAKFYNELRKNFFAFLGAIREFYTELMGCTEWEGTPFDSECLKKTNWSCPTCESVTNFMCGLTGQLGTGMALGALLGVSKAAGTLAKMKRQISEEPARFGLGARAIEELNARKSIQSMRDVSQRARYQVSQGVAPVTNFLNTALGEMKTLFAVGNNFKQLIAVNPLTAPFHMAFQAGQKTAHRTFNRLSTEGNIPGLHLGPSLTLGRAYGRALTNIQNSFQQKMNDLYPIRGSRFNPTVYNDISRRYIADVKKELERINIKATPIQGGRGLRIEKGGEVFEYRPNLRQKMNQASDMSKDDFTRFMTQNDPLLDSITPTANLPGEIPVFLRDLRQRSHAARNTFVAQSGASDGFTYLAYFNAQSRNVPENNRCEDLLYEMELVGVHDVTERTEESTPAPAQAE